MFFFLLCAVCERVKNLELKQVREVQDRPCSDPQNRGQGHGAHVFFLPMLCFKPQSRFSNSQEMLAQLPANEAPTEVLGAMGQMGLGMALPHFRDDKAGGLGDVA